MIFSFLFLLAPGLNPECPADPLLHGRRIRRHIRKGFS
jgi:hypothetical protein